MIRFGDEKFRDPLDFWMTFRIWDLGQGRLKSILSGPVYQTSHDTRQRGIKACVNPVMNCSGTEENWSKMIDLELSCSDNGNKTSIVHLKN